MNKSARLNGFDALRSIAMWLGIVLHSLIAYKTVPEDSWPFDPTVQSGFYNWLYDFIHIFRMPLFFMVAGYFARLVIEKKGEKQFVQQRTQRILIPFLVSLVVLVPITLLPFHLYKLSAENGGLTSAVWNAGLKQMLKWNGMAHLWFLYYLIMFYVLSVLLNRLPSFPKANNAEVASVSGEGFAARISYPILVIGSVLIIFLVTRAGGDLVPPVYTGIKIPLFNFGYYAFFYFLGYFIHANNNYLGSFSKYSHIIAGIGIIISVLKIFVNNDSVSVSILYFISAVETVFLIVGITGLFLRYFHRENAFWRYCSDAAYWMYLVHMGIVAALQLFLRETTIYPPLKLPMVLGITFFLCLASYQLFVRKTLIGKQLNGKKN